MLKGIQVVVADDDEMSLAMLSTVLGGLSVQCTAVTNGKEALAALEANPDTDVVLLDLHMPVMDGFEVLSHCKSNPILSDIPFIVLTANRDEKLKSLKLGAADFLAKPYDMEELELRILKLVQWRRLTQSAKQAKNEFLAIASHELRTPMNQIIGLTELLDGENLGDEQREFIGLLKYAAGSMTGIIRDILNYAQLDQGAASALVEPFSLRSTINNALNSLQESVDKSAIRLNLTIAADVSDALVGIPFYVYKVFSILLENAIKFSTGGDIGMVRLGINRLSVNRVKRLAHGFVNRRMRVDGVDHRIDRRLGLHRQHRFADQFERLRPDDVDAQNLAMLLVRHDLHEAVVRPRMVALLFAANGNLPTFTA